ncbi:MAG: hypothetical protein L3K07_02255 [Thermoplasmata archaeon]|nr:hypothetical protein [Thermoplasmata archaeon]
MTRPSNESIATAVCLAVIFVLLALAFTFPGNPALATTLGILGGLVGGLLLSIGLYLSQTPSLKIRVADDKFNPKLGGMYFLHVVVKNEARGFLGGGTAIDCEGVLRLGTTIWTPKWATRPEPLSWHLIPLQGNQVQAVPWIDWSLMEECKSETLGPGEEKTLDIAVKVAEDAKVYIHEPRNYEDGKHKKNPLEPGVHHLTLAMKYRGGQSAPVKLRLENDASTVADSARVVLE